MVTNNVTVYQFEVGLDEVSVTVISFINHIMAARHVLYFPILCQISVRNNLTA